jgi:hypothetical protein
MVRLRRGRELEVSYLSSDDRSEDASMERQVHERCPRPEAHSLEGLVTVAKALMERYKSAPDEAAETAAMLNVAAEDLSTEQTEQLIASIRTALDNE